MIDSRRKISVLFLCTANSARSQIAEALLRVRGGERFIVHSAGMESRGIHPLTTRVLAEIGIDISQQRSKCVREYLGKLWVHSLVIVCQQANVECPKIFPGMVERYYWPFEDPAAAGGSEEEKLDVFRRVRDQIDCKVQTWLADPESKIKLDTAVAGLVTEVG